MKLRVVYLNRQSHEISNSSFSHQTSPRLLFHDLKYLPKLWQFAKIYEFQIADDAADTWLSGVSGTAKSKLSAITAKSKLSGVIDTLSQWKLYFAYDLVPWLSSVIDTAESKPSIVMDTAESKISGSYHWHRWVSEDTAESILETFKGSHFL